MQGPKQGTSNSGRAPTPVKGRVIDMRAWKAKKRLQNLRGKRTWQRSVWLLAALAVTIVTAVFAILSCIPSGGQTQHIVLTWFFAAIGSGIGIVLNVAGERLAKRLLFVNLLSMAVSLVAAVVK